MFFKRHLKTTTPSNNNTESPDVKMVSENEVAEETNLDQSLFGASSLFNKFRNQNSGPDVLYENEAWSPENEYVGLFRKRRTQVEEQPSPTSDHE